MAETPEAAVTPGIPEPPQVPEVSELDRVLIAYAAAGHGRLFCTCGYLIWTCPCTKGCNFTPRMIETDHKLCIRQAAINGQKKK